MIDSLLFLTDDVDVALDLPSVSETWAAAAEPASLDDAEAAAAVDASRHGHAHAERGAWTAALAQLEHSAAVRDALVATGTAGPAVAARGWCDVATVRLAAGDLAGARGAFVQARLARTNAHELPADLTAALAELDAELAPGGPMLERHDPAATAAATREEPEAPADAVGGLLWLDTTEAADELTVGELTAVELTVAPTSNDTTGAPDHGPVTAATGGDRAPPARIAAVDVAVELAHAGRASGVPGGGWGARLRRLIRR